jgi:uncharacterized protein YebE (UPF0316 family)
LDFHTFINSDVFKWVILPLLIFLGRIVDVSIGTIRIIYVARGLKLLASIFGFFEVLIWLVAITQIMQQLSNFVIYLAYAAGFATGNYLGIFIESKLAMGYVAVRAIAQKEATGIVNHLREKDFSVTSIEASGISGKVRVVIAIIRRKDLDEVISIIKEDNPNAFYSVEDVKSVSSKIKRTPDTPFYKQIGVLKKLK